MIGLLSLDEAPAVVHGTPSVPHVFNGLEFSYGITAPLTLSSFHLLAPILSKYWVSSLSRHLEQEMSALRR